MPVSFVVWHVASQVKSHVLVLSTAIDRLVRKHKVQKVDVSYALAMPLPSLALLRELLVLVVVVVSGLMRVPQAFSAALGTSTESTPGFQAAKCIVV